jgi:hypothetical protein
VIEFILLVPPCFALLPIAEHESCRRLVRSASRQVESTPYDHSVATFNGQLALIGYHAESPVLLGGVDAMPQAGLITESPH